MNETKSIQVKVVAFGVLQEIIGTSSLQIECLPELSWVKNFLLQIYPALSKQNIQIAVNKQLVSDNITLSEGCEIALLPPFSGG